MSKIPISCAQLMDVRESEAEEKRTDWTDMERRVEYCFDIFVYLKFLTTKKNWGYSYDDTL